MAGKWAAIDLRICTQEKRLPYRAEPEDGVHPMIWLRKEPHRINEIPELEHDEALRSAVQRLNGANSSFETFRCESIQNFDDGRYVSVFGLGVLYRARNWFASYPAQVLIAGEILESAANDSFFPDQDHPFAIEITRTLLTEERHLGWTLDIWHESVADSAQEAKSRSDKALTFLERVLSKNYPLPPLVKG